MDEAITIKNYMTEAQVTESSTVAERPVSEVQRLGDGQAMVTGILDAAGHRRRPLPDATVRAGDILLLEGEPEGLDKLVSQGGLELPKMHSEEAESDIGSVEAVIGDASELIGRTANELELFERSGLRLLAVSRRDKRFTERLREIRFQNGDVIVLQGNLSQMPELLRQWDCLPLVERSLKLGTIRNGIIPMVILLAAMAATAIGVVPVPVAFFAAAVLMVLSGALPLREVYKNLDGPILIMLAALIPVSDSLRTTGATEVIGAWLSATAQILPSYGAVALIMVAAMAVTPFLNNAATVLVMAPIAAVFATDLGYAPEAFLMATAIGAGCDFLTPIGHQCNTLVMGPGGYRFGDYWRLGLPLSILVVLAGVPLLLVVWPL